METDTIIRIIEIAVGGTILIVYPLILWALQPAHANLKRIEKKIIKVCEEEGFEWTKEDGGLYIKRRGVNYHILLASTEGTKSARICFQYILSISELEQVHWAGQLIIENMLCNKHPIMNFIVDTEKHTLYAHYWADLHKVDDFKAHFTQVCDRVNDIQNEISEIMPSICRDFSAHDSKEKAPIGFR